jgi:hypothetical protein
MKEAISSFTPNQTRMQYYGKSDIIDEKAK